MDRFPAIPAEQRNEAQQKVVDSLSSGPRGGVRGPFPALLYSPELAKHVENLGEHLRFRSVLPKALAEFAILITARQWTAQFEWYAHAKHALNAGLDPAIVGAIAKGERPAAMSPTETVVYEFCTELHKSSRVGDATFAKAIETFDRDGTIELITLTGYYTMVSMILNVAEVPLPAGEPVPLAPLPRSGSPQ